jgi:serine/threonine-protein kinase HipA
MVEIKRHHIIDGCQALNLPPNYKYERIFGSARDVAHIRDGASLPKLFDFTTHCENPALTKQQMLDWVLFNILVFNFDAHGKNISFFVGSNGLQLTPFYDLVNIKMYPDFEQDMAMSLGDEFNSNIINAYQLADFADSCQLPRSLVAKRLKHLVIKLTNILNNGIKQIATTDEEHDYLMRYQAIIYERCQHLHSQIGTIASIKL